MKNQRTLLTFLSRHLVSFGFVTDAPGKAKYRIAPGAFAHQVSGFVLDFDDAWILVTAGHILKDIQSFLDAGHCIEECKLVDHWNWESQDNHAVPYHFEARMCHWECNDSGADFALLPISKNTRALLASNGVTAIPGQNWTNVPEKMDQHLLLGLPSHGKCIVGRDKHARIMVRPELIPLTCIVSSQLPSHLMKKDRMFYAKVPGQVDIDGWSGGPIFGFRWDGTGTRYWLNAVQSGWYVDRRIAFGVPINTIAERIASLLAAAHG